MGDGAATWIPIATALLVLLVLWVQYREGKRASRREEARLIAGFSERWWAMRADWNTALMVARGPDSVYHEVDIAGREQFRATRAAIESAWERARDHLTTHVPEHDLSTRFDIMSDAFEKLFEAQSAYAPYREITTRVVRFLGEVSGMVLRGHLRPEFIYEVLGPEVSRNAGAIREFVDSITATNPVLATSSPGLQVEPGLRLRVLVLIDLMWAEASRVGELMTQPSQEQVAKLKKAMGTGRRNRKRCWYLARRLSGLRTARRLDRLLRHSTRHKRSPPWAEFFESPEREEIDLFADGEESVEGAET